MRTDALGTCEPEARRMATEALRACARAVCEGGVGAVATMWLLSVGAGC